MKLSILAVGPVKSGPEQALIGDYCKRFSALGRGLGLSGINLISVKSGGGLVREGERLLDKCPVEATVLRLDEHGDQVPSVAMATQLATLRDVGTRNLIFMIGGAEGYSDTIKERYRKTLAFGVQTWPHLLVRVMLAEQLYRAASILAKTPYHKA